MDDHAHELLADLNTNVAVMKSDMASGFLADEKAHTHFAEALKDHTAKLETLDNSIRGNGGAGLNERMNVAERFMGGANRMKWTVIVATVIAVVGAIVTVAVAVLTNVQTVQGATP